jgi:hypothetical protein
LINVTRQNSHSAATSLHLAIVTSFGQRGRPPISR